MYEEEDDIPSYYRFTSNLPFPPRFQAYASLQSGLHNITADANHQRVHSAFAQAFPHLNGTQQQNMYAQSVQSPMPMMSGTPTGIDTTFTSSQPVSPVTALVIPASPAGTGQPHGFSPAPHHLPSPIASVHTPLTTPPPGVHTPSDSSSPCGFFNAHSAVSSPISQIHPSLDMTSPSGIPTHNYRSMSMSFETHRNSHNRRGFGSTRCTKYRAPKMKVASSSLDSSSWHLAGNWDFPDPTMFEDASSEPPTKRRRSQPTIRQEVSRAHTPSFPSMEHAAQQCNQTFTSKPPGSLQLLYHKSGMKDMRAPEVYQPTIVLQNPPPPRSRHASGAQTQPVTDSMTISASAEVSPTISEGKVVNAHDPGEDSAVSSSPRGSDVGFAFNATPLASELLAGADTSLHDDLALTQMMEQPSSFLFDALAHDTSDDQFENWEDMLNIPASQPDNEDDHEEES